MKRLKTYSIDEEIKYISRLLGLLDRFAYIFSTGICFLIQRLAFGRFISYNESYELLEYIKCISVEIFEINIMSHWFPPGNHYLRIKFLENRLKELEELSK